MKAINYGWVIVGVGVLVKMAGLGFGRFAYSMLLPNMRESLGFNYFEMGLLSGGNAGCSWHPALSSSP